MMLMSFTVLLCVFPFLTAAEEKVIIILEVAFTGQKKKKCCIIIQEGMETSAVCWPSSKSDFIAGFSHSQQVYSLWMAN